MNSASKSHAKGVCTVVDALFYREKTGTAYLVLAAAFVSGLENRSDAGPRFLITPIKRGATFFEQQLSR